MYPVFRIFYGLPIGTGTRLYQVPYGAGITSNTLIHTVIQWRSGPKNQKNPPLSPVYMAIKRQTEFKSQDAQLRNEVIWESSCFTLLARDS